MACGCCTNAGGSTFLHACAIALIGVLIGAMHSARTPIQLRVDRDKLETTILPPATPSTAQPQSDRVPTTPKPAPGAAPESAGVALGLEITVADAFALFQLGTPFLDARHDAEFNAGHVTNAIRMTSDEFLPRAGEVMRFMPGPIVIYCTGGDCDASHNLAKALQQAGFTKLHIMKDGYPSWAGAHPELVVKP